VRCAGCDHDAAEPICAACARVVVRRLPATHDLEGVLVMTKYSGPIGRAVRRAKGAPDRDVGLAIAALFGRTFGSIVRGADLIVPVPSGPFRIVTRGFSLPHLLAHALSSRSGVPWAPALTARPTPRLAGMDRRARAAAVHGRHAATRAVHGRVLLVDDVVTSGATLGDAARVLRAAGAAEVWAFTACGVG
jgi:predicted amidophosphoribosyltransferase